MSTVTLSKPHCATVSAEKPEGIASHAFTTALPDAQICLTLLFAIDRVSCCCLDDGLARSPLDAHFTDAHFAGGVHYRRPGIVRQGDAVPGALGARLALGIAGDQHPLDAGDRFRLSNEIGVARDLAVEEMRGVDDLGVDIEGEH